MLRTSHLLRSRQQVSGAVLAVRQPIRKLHPTQFLVGVLVQLGAKTVGVIETGRK